MPSMKMIKQENEAKGGRFKYGFERMLSLWNTYMPLYCYTD
jgi:hypothetical protein